MTQIMSQTIKTVTLDQISLNPYQPRKHFSVNELEELAASLTSVGLIQPPVVRPIANESDRYELVSGERRFRAAQLANFKEIPVIIQTGENQYSAEASLIENIQRVDLNPLEISKALQKLIDEFNYQQDELANRVGKKRSTVANYLRLLSLPRKIQEGLSAGDISMGHAKAILSVDGFEKQLILFEEIINNELSVREAEHLAQNPPKKRLSINPEVSTKDCYLEDLQERMRQKLGTKVSIQSHGKKGKITIDYYNLDDLDRLLELFGV